MKWTKSQGDQVTMKTQRSHPAFLTITVNKKDLDPVIQIYNVDKKQHNNEN